MNEQSFNNSPKIFRNSEDVQAVLKDRLNFILGEGGGSFSDVNDFLREQCYEEILSPEVVKQEEENQKIFDELVAEMSNTRKQDKLTKLDSKGEMSGSLEMGGGLWGDPFRENRLFSPDH